MVRDNTDISEQKRAEQVSATAKLMSAAFSHLFCFVAS